jgi:protein TonB
LLSSLKPEQIVGLFLVLILHGILLYGLWSYRLIPTPAETLTIMVNMINPQPMNQREPSKPVPPKLTKPLPPEPSQPEHTQLQVEAPVIQHDEPVVNVTPQVVNVSPLPAQPVELLSELSVVCSKHTQPNYPPVAKRMNQQGKVMLRVELGEDGRVTNVEVKTSSGHRLLDDAAMSNVKTWQCTPPMRNGMVAKAVALQQFSFILGE